MTGNFCVLATGNTYCYNHVWTAPFLMERVRNENCLDRHTNTVQDPAGKLPCTGAGLKISFNTRHCLKSFLWRGATFGRFSIPGLLRLRAFTAGEQRPPWVSL